MVEVTDNALVVQSTSDKPREQEFDDFKELMINFLLLKNGMNIECSEKYLIEADWNVDDECSLQDKENGGASTEAFDRINLY